MTNPKRSVAGASAGNGRPDPHSAVRRDEFTTALRRSPRFHASTTALRRSQISTKTLAGPNPSADEGINGRKDLRLGTMDDAPVTALRRSPRFRPQACSKTLAEPNPKINQRRVKEEGDGAALRRSHRLHSGKKEETAGNVKARPDSNKVNKAKSSSVKEDRMSALSSPDCRDVGGEVMNWQPLAPIDASERRTRSQKLVANLAQEVKKDVQVVKKVDGGMSCIDDLVVIEEGQKKKKKRDTVMTNKEGKKNKEKDAVGCCGLQEWTKEQVRALQKAYLSVKPSPHFWKKVSIMVPGKTAQECFNRIHADLATPIQPEPRSRVKRMCFSPVGKFTFSDKSIDNQKEKAKHSRRRKNLVTQKTVRKLLRKNSLMDQSQEADYFSLLEASASPLILHSSESKSIGTPGSAPSSSGILAKCSKKYLIGGENLLSRFKTSQTNPSPEVLKQIKNMALHEKYIDRLHIREARRKASCHRTNSFGSSRNLVSNCTKIGVVEAARASLITSASEAINQFQNTQANCLNDDDAGSDMSVDSCNDDDV